MNNPICPPRCAHFPDAREDAAHAEARADTPQTRSPTYRLAYADSEFLLRDELRPVRLQLELLKPELALQEKNIGSTIVVFGSARTPDPDTAQAACRTAEEAARQRPDDAEAARRAAISRRILERGTYYGEARRFARIVSEASQRDETRHYVIVTGGGPGIMEAANRGAHDAGAVSVGLNIVIPGEQIPNRYVTPELCFQFHYFAIRKMHFLMRARALVIFPGGFGTLDELFETLTLVQTGKIRPIPILLFGESFWRRIIDFEAMVEEGVISPEDLDIFRYVESADDAWRMIRDHYENAPAPTQPEKR